MIKVGSVVEGERIVRIVDEDSPKKVSSEANGAFRAVEVVE